MIENEEILLRLNDYADKLQVKVSCVFKRTLENNFEFETKKKISGLGDVDKVLSTLSSLNVFKTEYRSEEQKMYIKDDIQIYLTYVEGLKNPWVKTKTKNIPVKTPVLKLPLVTRYAKKYKLSDDGYSELLSAIEDTQYFAAFHKDCFNIFLEFSGSVFSISFSLAINELGLKKQEMEFEYEGEAGFGSTGRSYKEAVEGLEKLINTNFPYLIGELSAETKYEALLNLQK